MSHIRSGLSGVSVPIGADGSSHNNITNNVVIRTESKERFKESNAKEVSDGVYVVYQDGKSPQEENPYNTLSKRDLETAQARLDEIRNTQPNNESNNPLYVNKFIVAQIDTLSELVRILTEADSVEITVLDPSCDCCGNSKMAAIDSIYVKKNNNVLEFKYCYVEAKQILESNHISMNLVALK